MSLFDDAKALAHGDYVRIETADGAVEGKADVNSRGECYLPFFGYVLGLDGNSLVVGFDGITRIKILEKAPPEWATAAVILVNDGNNRYLPYGKHKKDGNNFYALYSNAGYVDVLSVNEIVDGCWKVEVVVPWPVAATA